MSSLVSVSRSALDQPYLFDQDPLTIEHAVRRMTGLGASCPFPWVLANVPSPNRQRPLALGGENRSRCGKPAKRSTESLHFEALIVVFHTSTTTKTCANLLRMPLADALALFRRLGIDVETTNRRDFSISYFALAKRYHPDRHP